MESGAVDFPDFSDNVLSSVLGADDASLSPSSEWMSSDGPVDFNIDNFDTNLDLGFNDPWKTITSVDDLCQQLLGPVSVAGSDESSDQRIVLSPEQSPFVAASSSGSESDFDLSDAGSSGSPNPCVQVQPVTVPVVQESFFLQQPVQTVPRIHLPPNAQVIRIPLNSSTIPLVVKSASASQPAPAAKRPRLCILRGKNGKVQTAKVLSLSGLTPEQLKALKSGSVKTVSVSSLNSIVKANRTASVVVSPAETRGDPGKDRNEDDELDSEEEKRPSAKKSKNAFEPLILTEEERKIMLREKITLPDRYPLSREEERNLRRIRRKIRNKRSAQDSRQRKKQYVDDLEKKMKMCAVEKAALQERVKRLESENASLVSQLRNLQSTMAGFAGKATPMSTAFLIMVMSVALLLAPSVRDPSKIEFEEVSEEDAGGDVGPSFGGVDYGSSKFVGPRRMLLADMREVESAADGDGLQEIKRALNEPVVDTLGFRKRSYSWMDIGVSDKEDDDGGGGGDVPPLAAKSKRMRMDNGYEKDKNKTDVNGKRLEVTFDADRLMASLAASRNATGLKPRVPVQLADVGNVAAD